MVEVPHSFFAEPRWWRERQGWLTALPGLVADQCRRWG